MCQKLVEISVLHRSRKISYVFIKYFRQKENYFANYLYICTYNLR